ncbi:MAG: HAD family hydrolase [Ruminococcus sp.]|nr:HAD family hydrolase [Ruminococcus sp.]
MELFISDLDGTLLNKDAQLSDISRDKINALLDKGMNFTVATARSLVSAGKLLEDLHLKLPMILMNGVLIYSNAEKRYEVVNRLSQESRARITDKINELGIGCFMYTINGEIMQTFFEKLTNDASKRFYEQRRNKYKKKLSPVDDLRTVQEDVIYFTLLDTKENLQPLHDAFENDKELCMTFYKDIYEEDMWYLEIFSSKASKELGLRYIREKYGFDKATAFGDNLNDLPLFRASERKIAMGNAMDELKECCDVVIGTNEDDSVAKYLEEVYDG